MKRVADPTQPVITFFFALFLVVALTIAGCSVNTISGPDVAPTEETMVQETLPPPGPNAPHNEGKDPNKNPSNSNTNTSTGNNGARHN